MQKKGSEVGEYFRTLWNQSGTTLIKTMVKQGLNSSLQAAGLSQSVGGGMPGGAAMGVSSSMQGGHMSGGNMTTPPGGMPEGGPK